MPWTARVTEDQGISIRRKQSAAQGAYVQAVLPASKAACYLVLTA